MERSRRRQGFTLPEILVALLLLTSGIAWLFQANVIALRGVTDSYYELLAVKGVQQYQLEFLRSLPFADPLLNVQMGTPFSTPTMTDGDLPAGAGFYSVALVNPQLKQVTVEVRWMDIGGRQRSAIASTLIGQAGLLNK